MIKQKELKPSPMIVESLINLKLELMQRERGCAVTREILFKINSCLYSQYPNYGKK